MLVAALVAAQDVERLEELFAHLAPRPAAQWAALTAESADVAGGDLIVV